MVIIRSFLYVFFSIAADVQNTGFEINVKEIFCGDEVSSCSWVFQGHFLLVGLLLGQSLHLIAHLLVAAQQLVQLLLFSSHLLSSVCLFVGFQFEC